MKTLSLMETKAVSGGDFIIDGLLYSVPSWSIPANYYQQIDGVFCSFFAGIINDCQAIDMLCMLPYSYVNQYFNNMEYMTISYVY